MNEKLHEKCKEEIKWSALKWGILSPRPCVGHGIWRWNSSATLHRINFSLTFSPFLIIAFIASYMETFILNCFQFSDIKMIWIRRTVFVLQDSCLSRAFCWCCVPQPFLFLLGAPARLHFPDSPVVWWSQSNEDGSNGHHHQPAAWPFGYPLQSSMLSPSLVCCLEEKDALEEPGSGLQSTASPLSRFAQWPDQEMSFYMWDLWDFRIVYYSGEPAIDTYSFGWDATELTLHSDLGGPEDRGGRMHGLIWKHGYMHCILGFRKARTLSLDLVGGNACRWERDS